MSRRDSSRARPRRIEDALLEVARRELEAGEPRPEVWETARRLARGDDRRAVSAYLRLRVRTLLEAHEVRVQKDPSV